MAIESFSVIHDAGQAVYFRFYDPATGNIYDFVNAQWSDPAVIVPGDDHLNAVEDVNFGDVLESLYSAALELNNLHALNTPAMYLAQAMDDLLADEIISTDEFWLLSGEVVAANTATLVQGIPNITTIVTAILKYQTNRMVVDAAHSQLVIYDDDRVTPLMIFNLTGPNNEPNVESVYERDPV